MARLKNTTIAAATNLTLPAAPTERRPNVVTTTIQWTNTGTQTFTLLSGIQPTVTNTSWTCPSNVTDIEVLVVAGGGGGGGGFGTWAAGGGGGAGGLLYRANHPVIPGTTYSVTVGVGGAGGPGTTFATDGGNSVFDTLTAIGGGRGGRWQGSPSTTAANVGGSGGGGANASGDAFGAAGTAYQGYAGGTGRNYTGNNQSSGGGGGGAGGPGGPSTSLAGVGGGGGAGINFDITGTPIWYACGGGGGGGVTGGGSGLGGTGGRGGNTGQNGTAGTASTGSGGGGGGSIEPGATTGGNGGSGTVVIRYTTLSNGTTPKGQIRYNSEVRDVEVYDGNINNWAGEESTVNFGGHNLHIFSQTFTVAPWNLQSMSVTSSNNIAPDGTATASLITVTTGYTPLWTIVNSTANLVYTASGYFKAGTSSSFSITLGNAALTTTVNAVFNLATGTVATPTVGGGAVSYGATITNVGNGWFRCAVSGITGAGNTQIRSDYVLQNSATIQVWGLQLEQAASAGPYTRTQGVVSPVPVAINGYRLHTYTAVGTSSFTPALTGVVEVLVVAGGGAGGGHGGNDGSGGGGAGGLIYEAEYPVVGGKIYTVRVGAGGAGVGNAIRGNNGENSQFGQLIAIGGGGGGTEGAVRTGRAGGSGGGAGGFGAKLGGANILTQGNVGGDCTGPGDGGGGGAGGPGFDGRNGSGGIGLYFPQFSHVGYPPGWFAGGGGASGDKRNTFRTPNAAAGIGGLGGGGTGQAGDSTSLPAIYNGVANTGGGGGGPAGVTTLGGPGTTFTSGAGGSGIVIVRYRYS